MQYVKIKDVVRGKLLILMEARLPALYKLESDYEILERFPGTCLKGKKYRPLFDYFVQVSLWTCTTWVLRTCVGVTGVLSHGLCGCPVQSLS
ncbi:isoleucine--tRNA ligase, cytoplasmic-like [Leptonychotes weddellii]|uniref:Isoleucine--tRNA ligase, cytoplasmic-like n=1 Tax=Leptonychotes weddellii TaxID=9713 RepID=A0A7F8QDK9_LEPWE|nr:isoleucine--tRNA ligase, cytoplasmic-like [Leptonychotes weddellii]